MELDAVMVSRMAVLWPVGHTAFVHSVIGKGDGVVGELQQLSPRISLKTRMIAENCLTVRAPHTGAFDGFETPSVSY